MKYDLAWEEEWFDEDEEMVTQPLEFNVLIENPPLVTPSDTSC